MDVYLEIASSIKQEVSLILGGALSGRTEKYRTPDGYVRWGVVEDDIHKAIEHHLTTDG